MSSIISSLSPSQVASLSTTAIAEPQDHRHRGSEHVAGRRVDRGPGQRAEFDRSAISRNDPGRRAVDDRHQPFADSSDSVLRRPPKSANLTGTQVGVLTSTEIGALTSTEVQAFTTTQANALTATQLGSLTTTALGNLLDHAVRRAVHDPGPGPDHHAAQRADRPIPRRARPDQAVDRPGRPALTTTSIGQPDRRPRSAR